jgi:hypothetical protein
MKVHKIAAGAVFGGAVLAAMLGAGAAQADSTSGNGGQATSTNPTLNDAMGFGVTNHMKGNGVDNGGNGYNGDYNGVGNVRSGPDQNPSSFAGNRVATEIPATVYLQHPDVTTGNKVTPKK